MNESRRKYKNDHQRKSRQKYKDKILDHYGRSCMCCGEKNAKLLNIDHINNDGRLCKGQGNRKTRLKGLDLCRFLVKNNFPNDIQILCFNCNFGRQNNGGKCPHSD